MRRALWCLCALLALAACRETFRHEISFTAEELQAKIAGQFPLERKGKLARVVLRDPEVVLAADSERVGLRAAVEIAPALGRRFLGQMAFDAALDYNAEKGEFYLVDPQIGELELEEVPDRYRSLARQLAEQLTGRYLDRVTLYRLDSDDFEESLAKMVLKKVAVTGGRLVLHIGLL